MVTEETPNDSYVNKKEKVDNTRGYTLTYDMIQGAST